MELNKIYHVQQRQSDQQLILLAYSYASSIFVFLKSTWPILASSLFNVVPYP